MGAGRWRGNSGARVTQLPQPERLPTIKAREAHAGAWRPLFGITPANIMWLIVLEAIAALAVLLFLVWWTMFSGRRGGEISEPPDQAASDGEDRDGNKKLKG